MRMSSMLWGFLDATPKTRPSSLPAQLGVAFGCWWTRYVMWPDTKTSVNSWDHPQHLRFPIALQGFGISWSATEWIKHRRLWGMPNEILINCFSCIDSESMTPHQKFHIKHVLHFFFPMFFQDFFTLTKLFNHHLEIGFTIGSSTSVDSPFNTAFGWCA